MVRIFILFYILPGFIFHSFGQTNNRQWFAEIKWDNDFLNYRLSGTDRYYTNGLFVDLLKQKKTNGLLQQLFFKDTTGFKSFTEVAFYQLAFTPNDISVSFVSHGDYPYAGLLSGSYSTVINNVKKSFRLTSTLTIGTMGKASFAEEGQKMIHHMIHYQVPEGWDNEVTKPVLVNYDLLFEKGLTPKNARLQVMPFARMKLGMINTSVSAGATIQLGLREDYFSFINSLSFENKSSKKLRIYFTWEPTFSYVYWNGLLEPALRKTIDLYKQRYQKNDAYPEIRRRLFNHAAGIFLRYANTRIGFVQTFYAPELTTTSAQEVGTVVVAFQL